MNDSTHTSQVEREALLQELQALREENEQLRALESGYKRAMELLRERETRARMSAARKIVEATPIVENNFQSTPIGELLNAVLRVLPIGVWIIDRGGSILYENLAGQQMWAGVKQASSNIKGPQAVWSTETTRQVKAHEWAIARAITQSETSLNEEVITIEYLNGNRRSILNSAIPIWTESHTFAAALVMNQDVTDAQQASENLQRLNEFLEYRVYERNQQFEVIYRDLKVEIAERKRTEEQLHLFRSAVVHAQDSIYILEPSLTDPQTLVITYVNDAFSRLTGYDPDEVLGKPPTILYGPKTDPAEVARFRAIRLHEKPVVTEAINYRKEGTEFWVESSIVPFANKRGHVYWVVISRDTTERKRAEVALREKTAELQAVFEAIPDQMFRLNLDGKIVDFFAGSSADYNVTTSELLGQRISTLLPPDVAEPLLQAMQWVHQTDKMATVEYSLHNQPGPERHFEARFLPFPDNEIISLVRDITERKQAERALLESEERYREMFEADLTGNYISQPDGTLITCNQIFATMFGFETPEEAKQHSMASWYSTLRDHDAFLTDLCLNKRLFYPEVEVFRKDGQSIFIAEIVAGVFDQSGTLTQLRGVCLDVTERKLASQALLDSQRQIALLVETIPYGILEIQPDGLITFANAYAHNIFDYTGGGEVVGHSAWLLLQPYGSPTLKAQFESFLDDQPIPFTLEIETLTKFDRPIDLQVDWNYKRNQNDQVIGFVLVITDITERKRAKSALLKTEQRLELVLQGANLGLWDWNLESDKVTYSQRWAEMLGYSIDEIEPTFQYQFHLTHLDDRPQVEESIAAHLNNLIPFFQTEQRLQAKNGAWKWFLLSGKVIERSASGKPVRAAGTHLDITEYKLLQGQLTQSQKMESIGRLAGGIAHDFNNLLTIILGYTQLLKRRFQHEEDATATSSLLSIISSAERGATLTRQLLAFARQQTIEPHILNLNERITGMQSTILPLIGEHIEVKTILAPALPKTKIDASQFEQILLNLIVNARDAMPTGGTLVIETQLVELGPEFNRQTTGLIPGPYVMLAVSDNGVGIAPHNFEHIFEPFFTTKEQGKGTGLGLSTCYGIVKQNQGHITFYSEPTVGTVFKVFFPVWQETNRRATLPSLPLQIFRGTETILLVEDEPAVRNLARDILSDLGYKVFEAGDGSLARDMAKNYPEPIHLLIADIVMPRLGGIELSHQIREFRPDMKVIYISGYTEGLVSVQKLLTEGTAFLPKPFSITQLLSRVRELLDE